MPPRCSPSTRTALRFSLKRQLADPCVWRPTLRLTVGRLASLFDLAGLDPKSSSFIPALKVLMPLARSPITRGNLPAPNTIRDDHQDHEPVSQTEASHFGPGMMTLPPI
jgi:hypothetical protein